MTLKRLALSLALILAPLCVARADQASITQPTSGPHSMADMNTNYLNPALRALGTNFSGTNCTGIGSPLTYQWCVDTTARTLNLYSTNSGGTPGWKPVFNLAADGSPLVSNGIHFAGGMVCDGTTDDAPALQAAITASVGYRLFLPSNATCLIKSYISIPSNTFLYGQNTQLNLDPAATHSGSLDVTIGLEGTSGSHIKNVVIDGVTFNGAGASTPSPNHSRIAGTLVDNITVRNSAFQNFGDITSHTTAVNTYTHGLQIYNVTDGYFENSLYQNNAGDGLSLSNANSRVWIRGNRMINNYDSGIIPCTIGGDHIYTVENYVVVSSTDIAGVPGIGLDRCSNSVVANNWIDAPAGTMCIRVARYGNTAETDKDLHIRGNTCTGGSQISIEALGPTQGSQTVTKGGYWSVVDNTVIGASAQGIHIVDSQNGQVIGNRVISASGDGISEESFTSTPGVGLNIISGNIVDGASVCLRQLNSGGTILNSNWSGNETRNCSSSASQFVANTGIDGSFNTYTPTVTAPSGTLPTTTNTTNTGWKRVGTNRYMLTIYYNVTTLGSPTATTVAFSLPTSIFSTVDKAVACAGIDLTTPTTALPAYANAGAGQTLFLVTGTLAAHSYQMTCELFGF